MANLVVFLEDLFYFLVNAIIFVFVGFWLEIIEDTLSGSLDDENKFWGLQEVVNNGFDVDFECVIPLFQSKLEFLFFLLLKEA